MVFLNGFIFMGSEIQFTRPSREIIHPNDSRETADHFIMNHILNSWQQVPWVHRPAAFVILWSRFVQERCAVTKWSDAPFSAAGPQNNTTLTKWISNTDGTILKKVDFVLRFYIWALALIISEWQLEERQLISQWKFCSRRRSWSARLINESRRIPLLNCFSSLHLLFHASVDHAASWAHLSCWVLLIPPLILTSSLPHHDYSVSILFFFFFGVGDNCRGLSRSWISPQNPKK